MASTGYPLMIRISSGRVEVSYLELAYNLILRTLLLNSLYLLLEREYLISLSDPKSQPVILASFPDKVSRTR